MAVDDEEELELDDLNDGGDVSDAGDPSEGDMDPPWGATMVVNDITYAVSLFWQPLQDQEDPLPEVTETAEGVMDGADLYCLRTGAAPQYGIGNSQEGHRAGQPSAAAALAEKFSDRSSSVAVFEVDEGWWFIAVRNDLILSEEDILYLNEEDAKRAFFAMMAVPDWGRKIAPASWEIEGTEEVDIWDLLKSPGSSKLMRIGRGKNPKTLMIAGGAGLLVLYLGYNLISGLFSSSTPQVIRPITPLQPVYEEEQKQQVIETKPWEKLVVTDDLLNRCYAGIQQVRSMIIPGWKLGNITCTRSGISATWNMTWGHIGWVKRAFEEYGMKDLDYLVSEDATSAIATLPIGEVAVKASTPRYMIYELREELNNIFQAINIKISLTDEKNQMTVVNSADGLRSEIQGKDGTFPRLKFSFASEYEPSEWMSLFNKFSGLEILNLVYNPDSNTWLYEGQIYEPSKF